MAWQIAISLGFGAICGTVLRLPIFAILSVVYVIAVVLGGVNPAGDVLLSVGVLLVVVQAGYVTGLVARAAFVAALQRWRRPAAGGGTRYSGRSTIAGRNEGSR